MGWAHHPKFKDSSALNSWLIIDLLEYEILVFETYVKQTICLLAQVGFT